MYQTCLRYIQIKSVLFFWKKVYLVVFFFLNYNFNHIFLFFKNNNYIIKLGVFLTFFKS